MENKDNEVKPGSIIIPHVMTRKNEILSRAMTFLSEEDGIGKEIFKELESLMDKGEEVKPDFEESARRWSVTFFNDDTQDRRISFQNGCEFGMAKIWEDYVIPTQSELINTQEDVQILKSQRSNDIKELAKLREENAFLNNAETAWFERCSKAESDLEKAKEVIIVLKDKMRDGFPSRCIQGESEVKFCAIRQGDGGQCSQCV